MNRLLPDFPMSQFDQPTDRPVLLQLYSAAANASRAYGGSIGSSLYRSFEDRAQQLARELFDDISPQTAFGFHLLSYHTRGRDISKSNHYRDLANSMCDQLLRSKSLTQQTRDHVLRIKLINHGLRDLTDPGPNLEAEAPGDLSSVANQLLEVNKLMARFRCMVAVVVRENESHELVLRSLTLEQAQEGCQVIDNTMDWFQSTQLIPPEYDDIVSALTSMLKTIILFAGGQEKEAIGLLHRAVDVMELNLNLMFASDIGVMECFHFCFLVALAAGDIPLMQKIQGLQGPFSIVLPSTRRLVEMDAKRLKEFIESKKATVPTPPVSMPCEHTSSHAPPFRVEGVRHADPTPLPVCDPPPSMPFAASSVSVPSTEHPPGAQPPPSPFAAFATSSSYPYFSLSSSMDQFPGFSIDEFFDSITSGSVESCNKGGN